MKQLSLFTKACAIGLVSVLSNDADARYTYKILSSAGAVGSYTLGAAGSYQIGLVQTEVVVDDVGVLRNHAALWKGTSESFVDLNPSPTTESRAYKGYGDVQVGYSTAAFGTAQRAALWKGTASSMVDLHPADFESSS
ncbi:MAG: hypothetical protein K8R88_04365, partial [Armatimonadetes bacterium]|nr:hypothetical protein [Armatimonadota bacterium]